MSDEKKDQGLEAFEELGEIQGVVASTVKDGHVLKFKRSWLEGLLASHPGQEEFLLFIRRPDFKTTN